MEEFRLQFKSDALSCNMKQPLSLLTFANTQTQYNAKQNMLKDKLVSFSFRLQTFKSAFPLEMKAAFMSVCFSLLWTPCLMAVVILHYFFPPLSPYINSERKLAVFCSYVLNSSARQHAECSFWNCDGQIKITTCLSRQNDHSMMLPAEINSAVDSRGDSEAVSAAPTVQVLNI